MGPIAAAEFDRIKRSLTNQAPTADQVERIEAVRAAGLLIAGRVLEQCPSSRERSLALTHLEETVMWAVKSIVLEPRPSTDVPGD